MKRDFKTIFNKGIAIIDNGQTFETETLECNTAVNVLTITS